MSKIIRAYELRRGDTFIKQNALYIVIKIKEGRIYYARECNRYFDPNSYIGAASHEKVQLESFNPSINNKQLNF